MSSSPREPADLAALYAKKARNDATAAREFAENFEISDEIIGFHAQQAVEKWLKAVMAVLGLPQQRTHDIDQLGRLLEEQGVELPVPRPQLAGLTDFAVPLRYEDLLDAEPLDRSTTIAYRRGREMGLRPTGLSGNRFESWLPRPERRSASRGYPGREPLDRHQTGTDGSTRLRPLVESDFVVTATDVVADRQGTDVLDAVAEVHLDALSEYGEVDGELFGALYAARRGGLDLGP